VTSTEADAVEQTVRIAASPETVWRYWTEAERMRDWWGTAAELDPRPGGRCLVNMGEEGWVMRGEYVDLVPHERIVFSFGWDAADGVPDVPPGSTLVEVTLVEADGDTILTLRHTGLPVSNVREHGTGWAHFLPLLARASEGRAS
jgi:uncharacterized protein YndB with AHSA1/START domain